VFNLIVRMVQDPGAAEDLTQEVFAKVFRSGGILDHAHDQVEHGPLVSHDELARRLLTSGQGLRDDLRVVGCAEIAPGERSGGFVSGHTQSRVADERHVDEVPLHEPPGGNPVSVHPRCRDLEWTPTRPAKANTHGAVHAGRRTPASR